MSHLLKTVNPEASDAIHPAPAARRLPDVGELVIYHMRHGHARQGRTRFPAIVQGSTNERGDTLSLTVILEAAELKNETLVEEIGPGKDAHVWERPDAPAIADAFRGTVTSLHQRIGDLERENQELRNCVLGDFDVPKVSMIHILQDFENRLREREKEIAAFRDMLDGLTFSAPPAPRKSKKK